jgi:hypothetical protein
MSKTPTYVLCMHVAGHPPPQADAQRRGRVDVHENVPVPVAARPGSERGGLGGSSHAAWAPAPSPLPRTVHPSHHHRHTWPAAPAIQPSCHPAILPILSRPGRDSGSTTLRLPSEAPTTPEHPRRQFWPGKSKDRHGAPQTGCSPSGETTPKRKQQFLRRT